MHLRIFIAHGQRVFRIERRFFQAQGHGTHFDLPQLTEFFPYDLETGRNDEVRFVVRFALRFAFRTPAQPCGYAAQHTGFGRADRQRAGFPLRLFGRIPQVGHDVDATGGHDGYARIFRFVDVVHVDSLGYDIQLQRGRGGGYWMASRAFELSELKLLVDAVQSSSVISARTSKRIIHKLEALCSDYEGTQLQRQVYVDGRPKTDSQTLLYSIDALHTAINRGCLVQFRYKGSSAVRTVSPWQLAWENGCYYLIAYQDEKAPPVRHYRVDRMAGVLVLDEPRRGKEFFRTFDLPAYLRKHFNMFGGTEYRVTLRCTSDLEPVMRERFGREPVFCPEEDGYFHFDVPICVSQQFFGWVCGFGGKVEVTAPAAVRAQLHEMVQSLAEQHR